MDFEIVDNLDSTSTELPLSANQGRVLKEMWNNVITESDIDALFQ